MIRREILSNEARFAGCARDYRNVGSLLTDQNHRTETVFRLKTGPLRKPEAYFRIKP